ncbi:MAG TPA: GGDEF domain-containing protein [Planctomycetota bacterium]
MGLVKAYLAAFGRVYSYDPRNNPYLWFGLAWGLPVPFFSIVFDLALGAEGRRLQDVFADHPIQFFFLLHPLLFAAVFGAMGSLRHDLERENRRLIGELQRLATTDPLTDLANRRRVMEELDVSLARASRGGEPLAVVMFDLDGFKKINDEQGHPAGDLILKKTAAALRRVVRQGDVLGRYGGDEFLLVAHGALALEDALVERAAAMTRRETGLSVSAGVARFPEDGRTASALIETADARLYDVKRATKVRERSKS